jgi:hypothetical protein
MTGEITLRGRVLPIGGSRRSCWRRCAAASRPCSSRRERQGSGRDPGQWPTSCSARSPWCSCSGASTGPERAQLCGEGQRPRDLDNDVREAYQRSSRRPSGAPTAPRRCAAQCDQEASARRFREHRGADHARRVLGYRVSDAEAAERDGADSRVSSRRQIRPAHAIAVLKAQGRSVEEIEG